MTPLALRTPTSAVASKGGFSVDDDLDKVWAEVIAKANKITTWNLNEGTVVTIDEVMAKIKAPKDDKPGIQEQAKNVFRQTMVCVQRFGSFAAQSASVVFGPSEQCFNAISFVIKAIQSYDEVFTNITALMERISVFLNKLNIYLDDTNAERKLDRRLRLTVYRVLEHFLTILGTAHKLTHGWKAKLKLAAKIGAFGEDDGIKSAMAQLETLVSDVTGAEISVIVKDLSEAARNIRGVDRKLDLIVDSQERTRSTLEHLHNAEERRQADEEERKRRQAIQRVLGADSTVDTWTQRQDELVRTRLEGTGQWLLERMMFQRWADVERTGFDIICISGDSGYGKSYLSSIVIDYLQQRYRNKDAVCIAYYFHQRESLEKDPVGTALRAIIWQLAMASTAAGREYRRLLANVCERRSEAARPHELWGSLIKDVAKDMDATFFIILDGFDDDSDAAIKPLAQIFDGLLNPQQPMKLVVQFLITGRTRAINTLHDTSASFAHIELAKGASRASMDIRDRYSTNFLDIELFTRTKLAEMSIFKNTADTEILELRDRAEEELAVGVQGDFLSLIYKLDVISKSRSIKDLEAALELADESRSDLIEREIDRLNTSLSKEEILELNNLLMWVDVIQGGIPVAAYESIRRLRDDAKPLIPLRTQVEERYSGLLEVVNHDWIVFRTDDVRACLERLEVQRNVLADGRAKSADTFSQGEVEMVQRIVRTHFVNIFGKDDIYEKFKFDKFFASKLGIEAVHIRLEIRGRDLKVVQVCLTAICDHADEAEYEALRETAYDNFIQFLMEVKLSETSPATKQDIGRRLVSLFTQPRLIENWWTNDLMLQGFRRSWRWFQGFEYVDAACDWLQDADVQKALKKLPPEQEWILEIVAGNRPRMAILSQVAKHAAKWLFDDKPGTTAVVGLLRSYLTGLSEETIDWLGVVTVADLERIEQWAKEQLGHANQADQWDRCMATAYDVYGFTKRSTARFRNAIERSPEDWRAKLKLVKVLDRADNRKEAQDLLQQLIEASATLRQANELPDVEYRWDILFRHAEISADLNEHEKAETSYRLLLDELRDVDASGHSELGLIDDLIKSLSAQGKHQSVMDLLDEMGKREEVEAETWLNAYLNNIANTDISFNRLATAAQHTATTGNLIDMLDRALPFAPRRRARIFGMEWSVHSRKGELLWSFGTEEDRKTAVSIWKKAMEEGSEEYAANDEQTRHRWEHVPTQYVAMLSANLKSSLSIAAPPQEETHKIVDQMTAYLTGDYDYTTRASSCYALARWFALSGDKPRARALLQDEVRLAFSDIDSADQWDMCFGFKNLGWYLAVIDDRDNAVAAYRLCEPFVRSATYDSDSDVDDADTSEQEEPPERRLSGGLRLSCAGACTEYWQYAENLWICQDCYEVQLDENCYRRLCDGKLYVGFCNAKHSFLHLPTYTEEMRNARTHGKMFVGDSLVDKHEWLEGIRREWKLDAKSLEAREHFVSSVTKIQKAWAAFSRIRRRD